MRVGDRVSIRARREANVATHVVAVKVDELEGWVDRRRALGAVALEDKDEVGQEELCVDSRGQHAVVGKRELANTPRRKASKAAQPA